MGNMTRRSVGGPGAYLWALTPVGAILQLGLQQGGLAVGREPPARRRELQLMHVRHFLGSKVVHEVGMSIDEVD